MYWTAEEKSEVANDVAELDEVVLELDSLLLPPPLKERTQSDCADQLKSLKLEHLHERKEELLENDRGFRAGLLDS